jgi:hypothetical protein
LKGSNVDISTYDGTVLVKIPMEIAADTKAGEIPLKGTLRYQGCDAEFCFPPVNLPFELKLKIR